MIELRMVRAMARKGLIVAPVLVAALWAWGGPLWAVSGATGLTMALANLWLSARILGGVAERNPQMLMAAGLGAFVLGLFLLTVIAVALQALDVVYFPVTGLVLIGAHLALVLWEGSGAQSASQEHSDLETPSTTVKARS